MLFRNLLDDDSVLGHHIRQILQLEEVHGQHLGLAVVLQLQDTVLIFYFGECQSFRSLDAWMSEDQHKPMVQHTNFTLLTFPLSVSETISCKKTIWIEFLHCVGVRADISFKVSP